MLTLTWPSCDKETVFTLSIIPLNMPDANTTYYAVGLIHIRLALVLSYTLYFSYECCTKICEWLFALTSWDAISVLMSEFLEFLSRISLSVLMMAFLRHILPCLWFFICPHLLASSGVGALYVSESMLTKFKFIIEILYSLFIITPSVCGQCLQKS